MFIWTFLCLEVVVVYEVLIVRLCYWTPQKTTFSPVLCQSIWYHTLTCNTIHYHTIPQNTMLFHAIAYNTRQYTILYNAMQYHLICKASHYGTLGAEKDVIEISSSVTNILYIHLLQAMSSLAYARKTKLHCLMLKFLNNKQIYCKWNRK